MSLNWQLFEGMVAGPQTNGTMLWLVSLVAIYGPWAAVALAAWAAWRQPRDRLFILAALVMAGVVSLVAHQLAAMVELPRPFMVGLGHNILGHGARSGMPSAHASVMFAVAFVFLLRRSLRRTSALLFVVAGTTAWARVYVGAHFPLDIVGGVVLGAASAVVFAGADYGYRRTFARTPPIGPS